ncbi:hypothetical protein BDA96_02G158600 [Sorghum bicolor]|jgi:hypothetical protein|uniref:Uncharacterized protein n=3 Tax=Sorghum bicolor TaxID=4558 RepID=A0A921RNP3_SORBI|nr:hypothetical protein BDA96_02G158600 [Sorghum bicolor]KXG35285.1 hypothetical protein SORBI_3002G152300 [Sorghum bicolor]
MADHHLLHFPPSNDLKLRGRAQHQPPNKALLKILRIRRIVHAFVSKHAGRVAMALGGARAMLLDLLSKKQAAGVETRRKIKKKQRGETNNKDPPCCICGCAEMHLNLLPPSWSSSSSSKTTAVLEPLEPGFLHYSYYDPSWDTEIPPELQLPPIAGYLERPDEESGVIMEDDDGGEEDGGVGYHEIDSLAERFIARCHERFMLEKQESYRRYQEMLARTMQLTEMT